MMRFAQQRSPWRLLSLVIGTICFSLILFGTGARSEGSESAPPQNFVLTDVIRTIDLHTTSITRVSIALIAKNVATESVDEFYVAVDLRLEKKFAFISVEETNSKDKKVPLTLIKEITDLESHVDYYKVKLLKSVKPGDSVSLTVREAYSNLLVPYPHEQPQTSPQLLRLDDNIYFLSPYEAETAKTIVKVKGSDIHQSTIYDSKSSDRLTYGEFKDVSPLSRQLFMVHWMENKPILNFTTLVRKIELSHWGNIWVEEHYELYHNGALLKGQFSRVDYQFTAHAHHTTNVLKELKISLPPRASEPYFKDDIGNVSTSRFRNDRTKSLLEIRPRYPIYGGWKYTWFHGYNVPLKDFVKYDSKEGRYILNINFFGGISDIPVDKAIVKIILPEGATEIKALVPFSLDKIDQSKHFTYFDTIGRPTLILEKSKLVDEYAVPIQVIYKYSFINLLYKPIVAAVAIFGLMILTMVYARLDLSITKDKAAEREILLNTYRATINKSYRSIQSSFRQLDDAFTAFKGNRQRESFDRSEWEESIAAQEKKLAEVAKSVEALFPRGGHEGPQFAQRVSELTKLVSERLSKVKASQNQVIQFLKSTDSQGTVDEKKKKDILAAVEKTETEIAEIEQKAQKLVKDLRAA